MVARRHVHVGLLQMAMSPDRTANLAVARGHLEQAKRDRTQLVVLPELFASRYFCQTQDHQFFDLAEDLTGPTVTAMQAAARDLGLVLVVPFFERVQSGVFYNSAVVIESDGRVVGHYRKMHIPDDPGFNEKFYFKPGNLGFPAFDTSVGRVGVLICWDQWFPEAARAVALEGAEIICVPTAIGTNAFDTAFAGAQRDAWLGVQRGHAIANQVFWAIANRIGFEPKPDSGGSAGITFWGQSVVFDPSGMMLAYAKQQEGVTTQVCNLEQIEHTRRFWPFRRDRRTDSQTYARLLQD